MTLSLKVRTVAMVLTAAAVGALPRALPAQSTQPDAAAIAQRDLDQLATTLNDAGARQDQREEAARRLISRQSPAARQILANALVDLNTGGQLAAAKALAQDPAPDPALVDPLFAALGNNNRQLTEAAARALANYKTNPRVLTRLIDIVQRRPPAPEQVRREIVRALGSLTEKRAAELLVTVLNSADEAVAIHAAAAEALTDMTGIAEYGQNAGQWRQWWQANGDKPDAAFRNELLPRRSYQHDQLRQRYTDLTSELRVILNDQYQTAAAAQRPDILMRYLKSPEPEVRSVGARIIRDDALDSKPIPAAAKDQLRIMIGDSNPTVRMWVADALSKINDAASLEPLLAQLSQETDDQVRAALAEALAPINDLRAVPALLAMMNDTSYSAARAVVQAIEQLGPRIRDDDPALAKQTAEALRLALERPNVAVGAGALREAVVDAMVPLRQESLLPTLYRLLHEQSGEPAEMRRLALKAIGEIGNPQSAATIVNALNDRDARVRFEAVRALGKVRTAAEYAETLRARLDPAEESDSSVRDETWRILQSVLPDLAVEQLNNMADRFLEKQEHDRRLIVLKALADQLLKLKREDELAGTRQNIGATLMKLDDPKAAAEYFRLALDYKKTQPNVPEVVIVALMQDRLKALLLAKQYAEAVAFAADSIRENPNHQQTMGTVIRQEADRLRTIDDLSSALALITEAKKMNPPLAAQYQDMLREIEADVVRRLEQRGATPGATAGPAPKSGSSPPASIDTASDR